MGDVCECHTRRAAQKWGAFQYIEKYGAWVFVDDTCVRRVKDRWRVKDYHGGEPYRWLDCPFCGLPLPDGTEPPPSADMCPEE